MNDENYGSCVEMKNVLVSKIFQSHVLYGWLINFNDKKKNFLIYSFSFFFV